MPPWGYRACPHEYARTENRHLPSSAILPDFWVEDQALARPVHHRDLEIRDTFRSSSGRPPRPGLRHLLQEDWSVQHIPLRPEPASHFHLHWMDFRCYYKQSALIHLSKS